MESFNNNTMKEEKILPVGTRVFDVRFGWGEIVETKVPVIYNESPILTVCYTRHERSYTSEYSPLLSLTEYTLEKGGFTPISDYWNKPKVGDWGYFWDNQAEPPKYGKLISIDYDKPYHFQINIGGGFYRRFSKDIPEYIKQQMNNETDK